MSKKISRFKSPLIFDTSALFNFGHRGHLEDLLKRFKREYKLIFPDKVQEESLGETNRKYYESLIPEYFEVYTGKPSKKFEKEIIALTQILGSGEIEAIVTAMELKGTAVIDEKLARRKAKYIGIAVTGTLGILKYAKDCLWIDESRTVGIIDTLIEKGLRIPIKDKRQSFDEYIKSFGK